ncbi:MAG: hypothetical protein KDK48_01365, partial [Chlamydiia bacterium]|nr:hypothetical protein [Chlamydiia bacterium]
MDEKNLTLEHHLQESRLFPPPYSDTALVRNYETYEEMYRSSLEDPDRFWLKAAKSLNGIKEPTFGC